MDLLRGEVSRAVQQQQIAALVEHQRLEGLTALQFKLLKRRFENLQISRDQLQRDYQDAETQREQLQLRGEHLQAQHQRLQAEVEALLKKGGLLS